MQRWLRGGGGRWGADDVGPWTRSGLWGWIFDIPALMDIISHINIVMSFKETNAIFIYNFHNQYLRKYTSGIQDFMVRFSS